MTDFNEVLLKRRQSWKDDLSQEAKETMDSLCSFGPTNAIEHRTVKGWMWDGDGCSGVYFTSDDLRETAKHLIEVANWLDVQAAMYEPDEDTFE